MKAIRLVAPILLLVFLANPAAAQYLRMTTDNPTDNTRLRTGVTNIVTITLDTIHDRDGSAQTCNSHTSLNCGAPAAASALDMFSYTIALKVVGGTVTWGTFAAADANYTDLSPQIQSDAEVEINQSRPAGTSTPPGLATLGTIPVTVVSGSPTVMVQVGASVINPFGFGTGFGTHCDGFGFSNTYILGELTDPCGITNGIPGDWFDWDGVTAATGETTQPNIVAPATASATEGTAMAAIQATATDADASNTLTITQSGMPADLTFTTNSPGPSPRTASISGTPGFTDAGSHNITWTVNDGTGAGNAFHTTVTTLTIANTNRAPVLNPVPNMTICDGSVVDQAISGSDPEAEALTFSKVAGPSYMTVTTTGPTTGNIHLAPPLSSPTGTTGATVRASDGSGLASDRSLTITIPNCDRAPTLNQPSNMTVSPGATADQTLNGSDPFGAALVFSKVAGPSFVTVTTTSPTTGNVHVAPAPGDAGTFTVTVSASDGSLRNDKSFTVTVPASQPPVLDPLANVQFCRGQTANQAIRATDPDGDAITFSATGPSFMTLTSNLQIGNERTGNLHFETIGEVYGAFSASVTATSGVLSDTRSFSINVVCPPVFANDPYAMAIPVNATADQTLSAWEIGGLPLTFSKVSGPTFVTVTTTSPGPGTATGNVHLAPGSGDAGTYTVFVRADNGTVISNKFFTVTICSGCGVAPAFAPIANMSVQAGSTADQTVTATDADGQALTFSTVDGPGFMQVSTLSPGAGTATGTIHLAPSASGAGTYSAIVRASDGALSDVKGFSVTVTGPHTAPVMTALSNPTVRQGGCSPPTDSRGISATDLDADPITFTVTGPSWVSVVPNPQSGVKRTGNLMFGPPTASGTFSGLVTATAGGQSHSTFFTVIADVHFEKPVMVQPADMTVIASRVADQSLTATMPCTQQMTFQKTAGPAFMFVSTPNPSGGTATGNIHLQPSGSNVGTYLAEVMVAAGNPEQSDRRTLRITVLSNAVALNPIANMAVTEGSTADQGISATDPDANPLTFAKESGPIFMSLSTLDPGHGSATGNIHLAPGLGDAGTYAGTITTTNGTQSDSKTLVITVLSSGNRCPTANAGGPYSGLTGTPVSLDGSASSDPDGDPLTYAWDFDASNGITVDATGATVSHLYAVAGTFTVTLSVSDDGDGDPPAACSASATTTAIIQAACGATVFNGYDTIRLNSGKPSWFAYVQPTDACYSNSDVIVSSFVMKYAGRQISASGKTSVGGDKSGDGIAEIKATFSKDDLRALFSGTGLPNGHNDVTVSLEANLTSGGKLGGTTHLDVVNNGNFSASEVAPNPLNPSATLGYTTTRPGAVRIDLFDVHGRLVRRLVDDPAMAAGIHEATIDGRGTRGEKLPSGVYYIRGTSPEGEFKHLITILK